MDEGVGDAHSTDDSQDNITWKQGRGITIGNVLDNRLTTKLMKRSNQKIVQDEMNNLTSKVWAVTPKTISESQAGRLQRFKPLWSEVKHPLTEIKYQ